MLKWILIIILSIGLPFIGIPWLIFELWKYYGEKRADAYFDAAMKPLRGTVEKDFNNREDFISQVKNDLASFEQMWRSRKMFSNAGPDELVRFVLEGERATWPRMAMVRNQTSIGRTLETCIAVLRNKLGRRLSDRTGRSGA